MIISGIVKKKIFLLFFILASVHGYSQSLLNKIVSVNTKKEPLAKVLESIGQQGNFFFSYNSNFIKSDSVVTIIAEHKTVRQVLDALFAGRCQYKETGTHVILQPASGSQNYSVSGYVYDGASGEKLPDATVYEPHQLVSTFTDENGFFKLDLKNKRDSAKIVVSKISYSDTSFTVESGFDRELTITVTRTPSELNAVVVTDKVEKTWLAKMFLTSRQRLQSLNISSFFASTPMQFSLVPGLGTHGDLSGQVVNKFSLNIIGGYTGGVNGVEIGGMFNIVKKDVQYFQAAGIFNTVGGSVKGVQIAGLYNGTLDSVAGVQVSGINNTAKGPVSGVQISGINNTAKSVSGAQIAGLLNSARGPVSGMQISMLNKASGPVKGMQLALYFNTSKTSIRGVQIAGVSNTSLQKVEGVQIAGLFNYTKKLKGFQLALINFADTSLGYSFGVLNISGNYHIVSLFADETAITNFSFKSGNRKLYNTLNVGYNFANDHKLFSFGLGIGSAVNISKFFFINPELKWMLVYNGNWDHLNQMGKFTTSINFRVNKWISIFAGPSFAAYFSNQSAAVPGYQFPLPSEHYHTFVLRNNISGWIGYQAGINLF